MDKIKSIIEMCDIAVKIGLAVAAYFFVDKAHQSYQLQKEQLELQKGQVENLKLQAEHSKIQAEQAKIQAEATSTLAKVQRDHRQDDAALVQMIVELLFKQNLQCRTEDQMVLISFLGEMNDSYNKVKLGDRVAGAFGKRRECALMNEAVKQDASAVQSSNGGKIPILTPENATGILESLLQNGEFKHAMGNEFSKYQAAGAIGYVALGNPVGANNFANFNLLDGTRSANHDITPDGSLLQATNAAFVRANRRSTDDGHNPIVGQIADHKCVKTVDTFPHTRGQTWALVKPAVCPERTKLTAR